MSKQKESGNSETKLSEKVKEIGFWREILHQARLVFHLMRDPEVPVYLKALPFLGVLYLILPIDLLPDVVLGLGQLDDLTVLLIGSKIFIELAPPHIVAKHRRAIRAGDGIYDLDDVDEAIVIEGDHEVVNKNNKQNQR
jgi:uncharacterized membrane protein YkvA (DUF1232 family)